MICDSTVINSFKVLKSALALQSRRTTILTTNDNFPADLYVAQGISQFDAGVSVKRVPADALFSHLDETVAVLFLSHVNYRDAAVLDIKELSEQALRLGIITVWDLSHSIGIVPIDLSTMTVDFAVGCTYKYLSGGPGVLLLFMLMSVIISKPKVLFMVGWAIHDRLLLRWSMRLLDAEDF